MSNLVNKEVMSSEESGEAQQPPFTEEQVGFLESLLQKTVSQAIESARLAGPAIPQQSTQVSDSSPGEGECGIGPGAKQRVGAWMATERRSPSAPSVVQQD